MYVSIGIMHKGFSTGDIALCVGAVFISIPSLINL